MNCFVMGCVPTVGQPWEERSQMSARRRGSLLSLDLLPVAADQVARLGRGTTLAADRKARMGIERGVLCGIKQIHLISPGGVRIETGPGDLMARWARCGWTLYCLRTRRGERKD